MKPYSLLKSLSVATLALGVSSCQPDLISSGEDNAHSSGLKQLVQNDFVCDVKTERVEMVKSNFSRNLLGGSSTHRDTATKALANLPDEYLNYVFKLYNTKITLKNIGGSTRGMTTSSTRGDGRWRPISIWVGQKTGKFDPLPHEVGHAMQHYIKNSYPSMIKELNALYNKVKTNSEGSHMRGYAKSEPTELWAEIFDSFYCSQESRDNMREKMPETLLFAERYLINPEHLDGTSGEHSIAGQELKVDTDNDGVINGYDKCADTPEEETILLTPSNYGCSAEQAGVPEQPPVGDVSDDDDDDGITNGKDKCPNTPSGSTVWKVETGDKAKWLGCAAGQTPIR